MVNKLKKDEMEFIPQKGSTCAKYKGTFFQKFTIEEARKCYNLWKEEIYYQYKIDKVYNFNIK